jgi:hypothetical protein
MTLREIYLEAARMIAEGEWKQGACLALDHVENRTLGSARIRFADMFQPTYTEIGRDSYSTLWLQDIGEPRKNTIHRRVMFLCMAAEAIGNRKDKKP